MSDSPATNCSLKLDHSLVTVDGVKYVDADIVADAPAVVEYSADDPLIRSMLDVAAVLIR